MNVVPHALWQSVEDYARLEAFANVKHEYLDGQIYAMSGGTLEHAAIAARIITAIGSGLRGRGCTVYTSDGRVRVTATGLITYPDVSVACGPEHRDVEDSEALTNPVVVVEVLSPTTESYDRGQKFEHYKKIPSLREVVFVSHREPLIEVWRLGDAETWTCAGARRGEVARLESINVSIAVNEVYG